MYGHDKGPYLSEAVRFEGLEWTLKEANEEGGTVK